MEFKHKTKNKHDNLTNPQANGAVIVYALIIVIQKKDQENKGALMSELIEQDISCPYCGESIDVVIEVLDESQEYIEDCQVCCRPIVFNIDTAFDGSTSVSVHSENDTY